jgi:hypothetical protein
VPRSTELGDANHEIVSTPAELVDLGMVERWPF